MPCLQRKLQLSVALKNINSDARRHKTDQISSRSTEIQDYMRSNVLFVHVLKCVACVHTWGCNSEALEWRGFVVCFCTACATSLRERERDACSSLPAQYTPCWAVHPQLKTYLYCPLELAAHTYMHTAHIHKHIDMHSEPKECASAKKNVTEHNSHFCRPAKKHRLLRFTQAYSLNLFYLALFTSLLAVPESKMWGKLSKAGPRTHPHMRAHSNSHVESRKKTAVKGNAIRQLSIYTCVCNKSKIL